MKRFRVLTLLLPTLAGAAAVAVPHRTSLRQQGVTFKVNASVQARSAAPGRRLDPIALPDLSGPLLEGYRRPDGWMFAPVRNTVLPAPAP
ncbi:MAG: hypothetical protein VKP63_06300 [Cyanobacteriota bacterium]|nr:hypothetical protein [Cyanobacteriota bacterium]